MTKKGVLAYWSMDEIDPKEYFDRWDTVNYQTVLSQARFGQGRLFNGRKNNHIETGLPWSELGFQYTISCRVKLSRHSKNQTIVARNSGRLYSGLVLENGEMKFFVPNDKEIQKAGYIFNKYDEFVNLTGVVDLAGQKASLYENGELKGSVPISAVHPICANIEFGKYREYHVLYPLNGILDEVILYNRSLSRREVREIYRGKTALPYQVSSKFYLKIKFWENLNKTIRSLLDFEDYFNLFYHESHLYQQEDICILDFALSKKDLRFFNQNQNLCLQHGCALKKAYKKRRVDMTAGPNRFFKVRMGLYGPSSEYWPMPKKAYYLDLENKSFMGMKKMVLLPLHIKGYLRPLLLKELCRSHHLPYTPNGICLVRINGINQGLYYFEEFKLNGYRSYSDHSSILNVLKWFPFSEEEVLSQYRELVKKWIPLFKNDRSLQLNVRAIKYFFKKEEELLRKEMERMRDSPRLQKLNKIRRCLGDILILNENPSLDCVTGDLKLPGCSGASLSWKSSDETVLTKDGKITRPKGEEPAFVTLTAVISDTFRSVERKYLITVMPLCNPICVLQLQIPNPVRKENKTPCLVKLYEPDKNSGWMEGQIKYRGNTCLLYPKKSYALSLKNSRSFFDFNCNSRFALMGNYPDRTLMKNVINYDLFRNFSKEAAPRITPKIRLVEVILNHEYQGVYSLSEKINAATLGFAPYSEKDPAHSVIYKAEDTQANFQVSARGAYLQTEPPPEVLEYWEPYESLIRFLGSSPREEFIRNVSMNIDIGNVIDFEIFLNVTYNKDGNRHNLFLARNKHPDAPFFIVPWDYDKSLGLEHTGWLNNHLFRRMSADYPGYNSLFKTRWKELRSNQLSEETLLKNIDHLDAQMRQACIRNFRTWPVKEGPLHDEVMSQTKEWIRNRLVFLDDFIEKNFSEK